MVRVAIAGAAGRMGRNLVQACALSEQIQLTQATDKSGHALIGSDAGVIAGIEPQNVLIAEVLEATEFDVLVDFTHPSVTTNHVDYCLQYNKKMVIGTTGCDAALEQKLRDAGDSIAIMYAPNMSVG
ncbi:MAG: 4-hydroxy-tetrahydrodipicolinate reductase, partial [Gammaproteobacteria bacterium]|nr:4-hydroxy-tetrahydrodipicolinate reductase [Gammaproteobacteria bacterium]